MTRRVARAAALRGLVLFVCLSAFLLPFAWAVLSSFRPEADLFSGGVWPSSLMLDHYRALWRERSFWLPLRNSLIVAGSTTIVCLALGAPAAYALGRLPIRGRRTILGLVLALTMFPQISIVSPLYLFLRSLRLIDTFPGLVLPYLTFSLPLTIWLLFTYFRQVPVELEEAALVDGATRAQAFRRIFLPIALPALATTAILCFIVCWNEFLFALSFTLFPERQTVPVAIALFRGRYQVPWGQVMAASVISTAPVAAIVLLVQGRIVRGLTAGALKG